MKPTMLLLDDLINSVQEDAEVRGVLVGAYCTVVCSRTCGMAATLSDHHQPKHSQVRAVGQLHTKTALELAEYVHSDNLLEASIGLAALNSLLLIDQNQAVEINAVDVLMHSGKGKNVALVGHFPFVPRLRQAVGQLWVLEIHPLEGDYPAEAAADLLPQADIVAITSSALINHTFQDLLKYCRPQALVMALGPSTPLSPVMFQHGVDMLAGSQVVDELAVLRTVGQGAGFSQVEGVRRVTFTKPNH